MSEYFSNFPRIQYDINGTNPVAPDYTVAINILIRQKIREAIEDDIVMYYPHIVDPETRPEILSYQIYGDVAYTWTIFYANNLLDPYWHWPLDENQFNSYLTSKYGSLEWSKTNVHHYEQIVRPRVEATGTTDPIPEVIIEIDQTTYWPLDEELRKIKYYFEYEQELNEAKRSIKLIDAAFISGVSEEFRGLFR